MTLKRNSSYTADVELSVSRINRLLRPLRNKCANLAAATSRPSGSAVPITYGSSSSSSVLDIRAPPALEVLHDPKLVVSRVHQESRFSDSLARQIYAVTNAYRYVLQAALPGGRDDDGRRRRRDVMALTDICAASVGRNVRGEVALCLATLEGELDEAGETAVVDELYESVPARFRSWTLIAHATSEIVDGCPSHHPMLMLSLLGVTLARGLYAESKIFLRSFLTALLRQPPPRHGIAPPIIAHPMHPSYLVELCHEWTRLAPASCAGPFTLRSFAASTLEVLVEHGSAAAWTCKSITRLAQLLRTRDFECFLTFLHGLIEALAAHSAHHRGREEARSLHRRLAKWTGVITSDFFSVQEEDARRRGAAHSRSYSHLEFYAIVEILASAHDAGLHLPVVDDNDDDDDGDADVRAPQAALVCAATHCLASPHFSKTSTAHRLAILALLRDINVDVDVDASAAPPTTPNTTTIPLDALAKQPLARLRTLAAALRAHDLGALERALWARAIEHGADPALVRVHAESACAWGGGDVVAGRGRIRRAVPRKRKRARCETPSPPLRRASRRRRLSSPSPSSSSSSSSSTSISVASTPSLSSAPSSSSSARSLPASPVSDPGPGGIMARTSEDEEASRRSGAGVAMRPRADSLKSVLADALRTRKDLRAERQRASSLRDVCRSYGRSVSSEWGYSRDEDAVALAPSSEGDVLDMFAYDDPF
ncbi:hypothetical protein BJV74DRAFT_843203 [Russula compacta]|nr:hypothetical protein BJV74DRAFT_843203 [Russula compacta]